MSMREYIGNQLTANESNATGFAAREEIQIEFPFGHIANNNTMRELRTMKGVRNVWVETSVTKATLYVCYDDEADGYEKDCIADMAVKLIKSWESI